MTLRANWQIMLGLAVLSGCGDPPSSASLLAGVPEVAIQETLDIGGAGAEGAAAFGEIEAATLLTDGSRLVVADGQTQDLHLFTLEGRHLRRIAGRGGGPGEHQSIRAVRGMADGGFCTWDVQTVRISRFDSDGELASTTTLDLAEAQSIRPTFEGFVTGCGAVLRDEPPVMDMRDTPEGMRQDSVSLLVFRPSKERGERVLHRPGPLQWFRNRDRSWGHVSLLFGEHLQAFTQDDEIWVGLTGTLEWTRVGLEGDTVDVVRIAEQPRAVTQADIEAERERRVADVRARRVSLPVGPPDILERMAESQREGIREVPSRDEMPAYDAVVVAAGGGFWFRRYPNPTEQRATWVFVDSSHRPVARVTLPRGDRLLAATREALLVATTDALDVPILRVLRWLMDGPALPDPATSLN